MIFNVGDTIFLNEKIYTDGRILKRTIMQVRGWYYMIDDGYGVEEKTIDMQKSLRYKKLERICK